MRPVLTLIQFWDLPARQQRWAAIAPKRNGPSARGRAGAVEVVFRGAQKHRQSIQRIALAPKTPIRVSTPHRDGPSFGRAMSLIRRDISRPVCSPGNTSPLSSLLYFRFGTYVQFLRNGVGAGGIPRGK